MKTEHSKHVELDNRIFFVRFAHGEVLRVDERKVVVTENVSNVCRWHASSHPTPKVKGSLIWRILEAAGARP